MLMRVMFILNFAMIVHQRFVGVQMLMSIGKVEVEPKRHLASRNHERHCNGLAYKDNPDA
jgi:hypothetical protein